MREHCEEAGICDERFSGWMRSSMAVPPHTRTSGMKSGGERGRRKREAEEEAAEEEEAEEEEKEREI